jgi:hypothetical protein
MILYTGLRNDVPTLKFHQALPSVKQWLLEDAGRGDRLRIEGHSTRPAPITGYRYDWDIEAWVDATP